MHRTCSFILAGSLAATGAHAGLNAGFLTVLDENELSPLAGYTVQDLMVNTTGNEDWSSAQLITDITNGGSIYQHPNGSDTAPNPLQFGLFPELEFDSYVDGNGAQPGIAGAAVDIGGTSLDFNATRIDIAWFNTTQNDFGSFSVGRFTLSDDAVGTWTMLVTSDARIRTYSGNITNGLFDLRDTGSGEPVPGDLDVDGFVGLSDLDIVLGDWNQTIFRDEPSTVGDLNEDHIVGLDDLDILLANWNQFVFPGDASAGDIDGDGQVGLADLDIMLDHWGLQIPEVDERADTNFDDFIGLDDLDLVLGNWNAGTPPTGSAASVPEPGTAAVLMAIAACPLGRRRPLG